jgi:hypothetical protein
MPQLAKGGKWVFGWVIIGSSGEIAIPPEAYREYDFQAGDAVIFLKGSRRSGGFGVGRADRIPALLIKRALGHGQVDESGRVIAPPDVGAQPGDRLLAVRGSGLALGLVARGPIYKEAMQHPELEIFGCCEKQPHKIVQSPIG